MIEPMQLGFLAVVYYTSTYGQSSYKETIYNGTVFITAVEEEAFTGESVPLVLGFLSVIAFIAYNYLKSRNFSFGSSSAASSSSKKTVTQTETGTSKVDESWLSGTEAAKFKKTSKKSK